MHAEFQSLVRDTLRLIEEGQSQVFCDKELLPFFATPRVVKKKEELQRVVLPAKKVASPEKKPPPPPPPFLEKKAEPIQKVEGFDDLKTILATSFPKIDLRETPPDDASAKRIATQWKLVSHLTPVLIFTEERSEILEKLAQAISTHFIPAKVCAFAQIEEKEEWDLFFGAHKVRWILGNVAAIKKMPLLRGYLKENSATGKLHLGDIPLIPIEENYQDPETKRALWKTIIELLKK